MTLNKHQSWTIGQIVFAVLMSFLILGYLAVIATYCDATTTGRNFYFPGYVWALRIITGIMALFLGKLWKDKCYWALLAYLFLKIVRVIADGGNYIFDDAVSESLLMGFWVFSACYGMSRVFNREQMKCLLDINVSIWTFGMAIYSCMAIYAAWNGVHIYTIGNGAIWGVQKNRLFLVYFPTVSGSVLSISVVLALCGVIATKYKQARILFLLAMIPIMIALSLTDSRCAQVTVSIGVAMMAGVFVLRVLRDRAQKQERKTWYAWVIATAVAGVVFITFVFLCIRTISLFNQVRADGLLIPRALAESVKDKAVVSNRGFSGDNVLTNRPMIWKATIEVFQNNPLLLLWGTSVRNPMTLVNISEIMTFNANHCHCMPLMILLENGIPGLLLVGGFLVKAAAASVRLVLKANNKYDVLPVPFVVSILSGELIECFLWLRTGQCPTLPFFFIAIGIIISTGQKLKLENELAGE